MHKLLLELKKTYKYYNKKINSYETDLIHNEFHKIISIKNKVLNNYLEDKIIFINLGYLITYFIDYIFKPKKCNIGDVIIYQDYKNDGSYKTENLEAIILDNTKTKLLWTSELIANSCSLDYIQKEFNVYNIIETKTNKEYEILFNLVDKVKQFKKPLNYNFKEIKESINIFKQNKNIIDFEIRILKEIYKDSGYDKYLFAPYDTPLYKKYLGYKCKYDIEGIIEEILYKNQPQKLGLTNKEFNEKIIGIIKSRNESWV